MVMMIFRPQRLSIRVYIVINGGMYVQYRFVAARPDFRPRFAFLFLYSYKSGQGSDTVTVLYRFGFKPENAKSGPFQKITIQRRS